MAAVTTGRGVYRLKGAGIELTYRRDEGKLDVTGENSLLTHEGLDAGVEAAPDTGLLVTATLLESSRNGTRIMLTLMLPELGDGPKSGEAQEISGVAVVASSFKDVVGGPPLVLHSYEDVWRLEGDVSLPA